MDSVVRLDIGGRAYAKNYNTFSNLEMSSHFICKTPVFQVQWFKKRFEKKKPKQKQTKTHGWHILSGSLSNWLPRIIPMYPSNKTAVIPESLKVSSQKKVQK